RRRRWWWRRTRTWIEWAAAPDGVGPRSDGRARVAGDAGPVEARGEGRDRVAHEAAGRARRPRPSHDAADRRHAVPADAVVPPGREVRRPARGGHQPVSRAGGG